MKKTFLTLILPLCFSLLAGGCNDEKDDTVFPEAVIVKELPKLYAGNSSSSVVIQSQSELNAILTSEEQQTYDLQQVDFEKYTLLLGYCTYTYQITDLEHCFSKTGEGIYTYLLKATAGDATVIDVFRYGILVEKLPTSAKVTFDVEIL